MKRSPKTPMPLGIRLLASFGLIGEAAPLAPATFASFALLPVIYLFLGWSLPLQLAIIVAISVLGIWVSTKAEDYYGHDGSAIVIDEVAGMFVTFCAITLVSPTWVWLIVGFLWFRLFDIIKPFPAGRAQNLPKGYGVMLDDLFAGVYANIALRLSMELAARQGW